MRYRDGRRSICVSSQSGCPLTCTFCATGTMKFGRNLTAAEILDQVLHFRRIEPVDHLVFMGMGEPMMNLDHVLAASRKLPDVGITHRRTGISTVGWVPGIKQLTESDMPIRLALSLHAPEDALRSQIMPVNDRYPLAEVLEACRAHYERKRRQIFIEYVMLAGVNDGYAQAVQLAQLLDPTRLQGQPDPLQPDRLALRRLVAQRDRGLPGRAVRARPARHRPAHARPRHRRGVRAARRQELTRAVIADDELLLRQGLERLLSDGGIEVVASAGDAVELIRKTRAHRPDVVVTDVRMPPDLTDDGLRAAIAIRRALPGPACSCSPSTSPSAIRSRSSAPTPAASATCSSTGSRISRTSWPRSARSPPAAPRSIPRWSRGCSAASAARTRSTG